jgi:aminopeptidase-like protein
LEYNFFFRATTLGEPFLAKRNLYPDHHLKELIVGDTVPIVNILAYADGEHDLIGIAERAQIRIDTCLAIIRPLLEAGLLEATARPSGVARKRTRFRAKKPRDGH